jgi:hypothetical protein
VQGAYALRALERQLLGDHSTHRHTDHVRSIDAERVHEPERIPRHHPGRVGVIGSVGPAHAAVVECDHSILGGQGAHLERPGRVIAAEAHDQQQRLPGSSLQVVHLDIPNPNRGH